MSDGNEELRAESCSTAEIVWRLEVVIGEAVSDEVGESAPGSDLIAAAGEALGALRVLGSVSMTQLLYDFARLAGHAGHVPDDFEAKSKG